MDYYVDVENEYKKAKINLFRHSLAFSIIFTLVIVGDVLLVTLSKENYLVQYIIATVITIAFSWMAIYFFFNVYGDLNTRYRYFKGHASGIKEVEEVELLKKSDELCHINGLYVYPLYVRYSIGLNRQDKVIFVFGKDNDLQAGDKLTITTYQRILLQAEKHL